MLFEILNGWTDGSFITLVVSRLGVIVKAAVLMCYLLLGVEAKIKAPETAPVGEYFLIDGAESVGTLSWEIRDTDVSLFAAPDAKQIVAFCPSPRKVLVILTAKDGDKTSVDYAVVKCGAAPLPAPEPMPDVKPEPVKPPKPKTLPDGRFKVAQGSHDHAAKVAMRAERRAAEIESVAKQLEKLRDKIKNKEVDPTHIGQLQKEIHAATGELPPDVRSRWSSWGSWWGSIIMTLFGGGTLKTAADWILFLEETILGLRAVV